MKCSSCGKIISDTDAFCIYCGAKQSHIEAKVKEYITYLGGIKVKKTTTTLIGFLAVVIMVGSGGYFFIKNHSKSAITTMPSVITEQKNTQSNDKSITDSSNSKGRAVDKAKDSAYVIKDSDKNPITQEQLKGLTKDQLAMARNEILARHGYVYNSEPYKSYFNSKSWYKPNPKFKGQKADLSPLERHNVKEIMVAEGTKPEANYDADYHGKKD